MAQLSAPKVVKFLNFYNLSAWKMLSKMLESSKLKIFEFLAIREEKFKTTVKNFF